MELLTTRNNAPIENPDDDAILRAVLSIVDLEGEQVFLGHGPDDDEQILSVAAYNEGTGWVLIVAYRGHGETPGETHCTAGEPLPTSRIVEILQQHCRGDDSWQREIHWKPLKTLSVGTLGLGIAIAVVMIVVVLVVWFLASR